MRLLAVFFSFVASTASAQAPTSLRWSRAPGAETCIEAVALAAAVEARLAREVFTEGSTLVIEGEVGPSATGYVVQLMLRSGAEVVGERTLESRRPRCSGLDDSLVLMVALLVEVGEQAIEVTLPAPPVDDDAPAPDSSPPAAAPVDDTPPAPPPSWARLAMTLGARGAIDALPGPAVGVQGAIELGRPVALRVAGAYLPEVSVEAGAGRAARLSLAVAQVGACADGAPVAWLELGGCLSLSAGAVQGSGIGFDVSRAGTLPWLALELAGRARISLMGPLAVELALGLEVPVTSGRFVVGQAGAARVVYAHPLVAPFLGLSLLLWAGS